jgi:membrane protease YdiL (CAAX protease family)
MSQSARIQISTKTLVLYFMSIFAVTLPFWILGSVTRIHGLPFNMQLNVLAILVIPLVTMYFIAQSYGVSSLKQVARDCLPNLKTSRTGIMIALLTMPLVTVIVTAINLPFAVFDGFAIPLYLLPVYFIVYYIAAILEEIGWTWYATPLFNERMGLVYVGIVIGIMWSAIHVWPWLEQNGLEFTIGMIVLSILNRVIMTWLYLKKGRILWLNIAFHAMINVSFTIFHHGSPYANPLIYASVLFIIIILVTKLNSQISSRTIKGRFV